MNLPSTPPRGPSAKPTVSKPAVIAPSFQMLRPKSPVPRVVINGVEGIGKTSMACQAPGAAIIMARGETGYVTLLDAGRVPSIPSTLVDTWDGLLALLDGVIADRSGIQTLILDALGGFERLCHEHVCERLFGGDWSETGFGSFQKGYDLSINEWLIFLGKLDRVHAQGVAIWLLSHVKVKTFKNPAGMDFDRYESACHALTWGVTHKWSDTVLFYTFRTITDRAKGSAKAKGIGGSDRVMYADRRDAYDAKNRYGIPAELTVPNDPAQVYQLIQSYINPKKDTHAAP